MSIRTTVAPDKDLMERVQLESKAASCVWDCSPLPTAHPAGPSVLNLCPWAGTTD